METQEPTIEGSYLKHPAFAQIHASRVSQGGGGKVLYGSEFLHAHYVTIRIETSRVKRAVASDHYSPDQSVVEVALSEAQWATFVSSMNHGSGTPCTLTWQAGEGYLPRLPSPRLEREQITADVKERLDRAVEALKEVKAHCKTKAANEAADAAIREITANLPWVMKQFDEHTEKVIEKAKIEVEAYLSNAISRAGLEALQGQKPLQLKGGDSE